VPEATVAVRPATSGDAPAVYALVRRLATSFVVSERDFLMSLETVLSSHGARLLVAEGDGRVVGYLLGFSRPSFWANGPIGWIEEVMVEEGVRRRRIGARLVAVFEEWARSRGARLVAVSTRRATAFYEALGYEGTATYFRKGL
jgi:GNAT superfamily N-acetyltransferase